MRSRDIIALAVALVVACLIFYLFFTGDSDCQGSISEFIFWHAPSSTCFLHLVFMAAIHSSSHFYPERNGQHKKAGVGGSGSKLSVFKGREARLNRAIFLTLFQNGPLVVYDITKEVKKRRGFRFTKYTNVNRRVRALLQQGYLESVGSRNTQAGSQGTLYQPTMRAKVAFYLTAINPDQFIKEANEQALITELAALALFLEKKCHKNMSF
jgi:hypothetical protein